MFLLNVLFSTGYKVSKEKAQISKETVKCLGLIISKAAERVATRFSSREKKQYDRQLHQEPTSDFVGFGEWLGFAHLCS